MTRFWCQSGRRNAWFAVLREAVSRDQEIRGEQAGLTITQILKWTDIRTGVDNSLSAILCVTKSVFISGLMRFSLEADTTNCGNPSCRLWRIRRSISESLMSLDR